MNQREYAYLMNSQNILKLCSRDKNAKFLDLGCDDGKWTTKMAKKIGTRDIFGTEILSSSVAKAKKRGINVKKADCNIKLPYANQTFDIVHSNQVIEHLTNTDMFLEEIHRILKPNGYAIISTENLASWHNIFALLFGFIPFSLTNVSSKKAAIGNPLAPHVGKPATIASSWQHMRIFTVYGLKDLSENIGFSVEKVLTSGYYPLGNWFARMDPTHSHFFVLKLRKV